MLESDAHLQFCRSWETWQVSPKRVWYLYQEIDIDHRHKSFRQDESGWFWKFSAYFSPSFHIRFDVCFCSEQTAIRDDKQEEIGSHHLLHVLPTKAASSSRPSARKPSPSPSARNCTPTGQWPELFLLFCFTTDEGKKNQSLRFFP